jgi:hydrogenase maturation protease
LAYTGYLKGSNFDLEKASSRITVLGAGNILLKDDGIGVHVARHLDGIVNAKDVEVIDAGTCPDLSCLVSEDVENLIVIDAVDAEDNPGAIYRFTLENLDLNSTSPLSLHEIGLVESLRMISLINKNLKSVVVFGIAPAEIGYGFEPSAELSEKIPEVADLVIKEIERMSKTAEVNA